MSNYLFRFTIQPYLSNFESVLDREIQDLSWPKIWNAEIRISSVLGRSTIGPVPDSSIFRQGLKCKRFCLDFRQICASEIQSSNKTNGTKLFGF